MNSIEIKLAKKNGTIDRVYEDLVEKYIREKYTLSQELAILRQKETKLYEYNVYYEYAEECKSRAKQLLEI